ncbi:MAG: MoaD/ThiS family protein [Acidimicrobiaceae bacterium]|nr:MoaD/ThiS family protein [Acidimicrobiaceae bacterium]
MATVRLFGPARVAFGASSCEVAAVRLAEVVEELTLLGGPELAAVLARSQLWLNGLPAEGGATPIAEGDEVAVVPPVSGG